MGSGRWSDTDWKNYSTTNSYDSKSRDEIFTTTADKVRSHGLDPLIDPKGVKVRESRDSPSNPASTPVIFATDVTGSMGHLAEAIARGGMNKLITEIYGRQPIHDPHVMVMAIGDAEMGDQAPLQVTQFEAQVDPLMKQLEKIFIEGGGGGNQYESYALAWYFAWKHTSIDSFDKRGKKGYLFTVGDEYPTPHLKARDIERVLGYNPEADFSIDDLLTGVTRQWEVFHLVVQETASGRQPETVPRWQKYLGQRVIPLTDHTKLAEVIVSTLQVIEGTDVAKVVGSWDGSTAVAVRNAVSNMGSLARVDKSVGVVSL